MSYAVGQVAELAGVTVRTLHHYDRIGLLSPEERSEGGYRRYNSADLERLHRILSYRELGLALEDIASLLDEKDIDPIAHLSRQERLLGDRIARLEEMLAAVQTTKEAHRMGMQLTPEERFELFGDFDPAEHAAEADERWGGSLAYEESQRRPARYSKGDWRQMRDGGDEIEESLAAAMAEGAPPDGERAMDLAEAHRCHIDRWFYDCSTELHRGLADMYVADERFSAHYERRADGLVHYLHEAINANAERASA